jgi:hypothetical protein
MIKSPIQIGCIRVKRYYQPPCPVPTADTLFTTNCGSFVKKPMKLGGSWKLLATKRQVEDEV